MLVVLTGLFLIGLPGTFCLYSHMVIRSVLTNTSSPPKIDIKLSSSFSHIAAMGSAKKAIRKFESATWIASKFFNALKKRIIDKKLWKTVRSKSPIHVLPVKPEKFFSTFPS